MRAQAFQNKDQLSMMAGRKTLEINPNHPVVYDLLQKIKVYKLMSTQLGVDPEAPVTEIELPEVEEEAEDDKDDKDEEVEDDKEDDKEDEKKDKEDL